MAAGEPDFAKVVNEKAAALVTIKFVLKIEFNGNEQEREEEVTGVLIDGKGLILCTNRSMGGVPPAMAKRFGNMSIVPTKIKVLVGDDTEGVDGKLIARDSDLDLAWVRVDKAPEKAYTFVDFKASAEAKLGENLMILDRLSKTFDRVPMISEMRVGAVIKKPRVMLFPAGILNRYGVPLFNAEHKTVGFAAFYNPDEEDSEGDMGEGPRPELIVVPSSEIVSATERALKTAESGGGEAKKEEAKPAEGEKVPAKDEPAEPKKAEK